MELASELSEFLNRYDSSMKRVTLATFVLSGLALFSSAHAFDSSGGPSEHLENSVQLSAMAGSSTVLAVFESAAAAADFALISAGVPLWMIGTASVELGTTSLQAGESMIEAGTGEHTQIPSRCPRFKAAVGEPVQARSNRAQPKPDPAPSAAMGIEPERS